MLKVLSENESETLFKVIDQSIEILQRELSTSYMDAFIETGDNLLEGEIQVEDGKPDSESVAQLKALYDSIDLAQLDAESIRRAVQFAMLKAVQQDKIQPNHQLTPDTIGMIVGYLVSSLTTNQKKLKLLDLSVGTGNLLTTVMNDIKNDVSKAVSADAVDNDDTMLAVAQINAALQSLEVNLVHQDALSNLNISLSDVAIGDLPVGYYPVDENAKDFQTDVSEGHSYVHHLLIEQAMAHVKAGGFGIFLVPANLFESDQSKLFLKWIQEKVYFQGFLNLPQELFQNKNARKSILILQNQGQDAKQAGKVMLGEFPSFKQQADFKHFMAEIIEWEHSDLHIK
ncbi:DNA methyltransferase [Secundilactobacillus oryzae JCM 18671]|uniref:DNA methyltransferase n=1 Tax=Secundilactobacillus oryzae JCM 18671 TaxID=1291743 RepID=A0A081BIZ1_9LACO|nr:class I SAM-dependent methyltransferase [Secundilactobacillus oryzae]GAK48009.1 DNA methyltransferase [Secundilactobacillus oryzae JCM 18671]